MSGFYNFFKLTTLLVLLTVSYGISLAQSGSYSLDDIILEEPITADVTISAYKSITLRPGFSVAAGIKFTAEILADGNSVYTGSDDNIKNWAESKAYDIDGNVIAHNKSYFDLMGKPVQSQVANFTEGKAIISQTLYDALGRPAISTLPAAITNPDLNYKTGFIADIYGGDYTYVDFDSVKLNDPVKVNQAIENSLGWYYSNNNTTEPYVPASAFPYTRVEYSKITGAARRGAMAGEHHKMGSGHEAMSFSMPASEDELKGFSLNHLGGSLEYKGLTKTIVEDAMGKQVITYTNSSGNVIATCMSKKAYMPTIVKFKVPVDFGYIDIHIPEGREYIKLPANSIFNIINLVTESTEMVGGTGNSISFPAGFYRLLPFTYNPTDEIEHGLDYIDYSFNIYDKVGRLVESYSPKATDENIYTLKTTYRYNSLGWLLETNSPDEGKTQYVYRKDGSIRFSQNAEQLEIGWGKALDSRSVFSYSNYDESGRIIEVGECQSSYKTFSVDMDPKLDLNEDECRDNICTFYDMPDPNFSLAGYTQEFLAGAVSKTRNENTTTWYSYTYDGKIDWIAQQIMDLGIVTIDYEYDFNGNVTRVIYQKDDYTERFDHIYSYDIDLRLVEVKTQDYTAAGNPNTEQLQAKYYYYAHGPLKRIEIADGLQGVDYVYNINGWLKSINDPSLLSANDPGNDSEDLFGMALDYYTGDYTRTGTNIEANTENDLFDGNISAQRWQTRTSVTSMNAGVNNHWLSTYTYNNRNFLQSADFGTYSYSSNTKSKIADAVNLTYDANGNILTLNRFATTNAQFDQFAYAYTNGNNQLTTLNDAAAPITIDGNAYEGLEQGTHAFSYNKIGQMTQRNNNGVINYYKYNVYGKVIGIYTDAVMTPANAIVEYDYDDKGFRVRKTDYIQNNETWYVRDASGNILSIYAADNGGTIVQTELPIYGSGRIGTNYKIDNQFVYELSDHLGNVRATFGKDTDGSLQLYSYADYYPFGMKMAGRMSNAGSYRFGYQGQFAEDETEQTGYNDFELRLWDSRIGRWTSTDPYGQFHSPYIGMANNPIMYVDPDGGFTDPGFGIGCGMSSGFKFTLGMKTALRGLSLGFSELGNMISTTNGYIKAQSNGDGLRGVDLSGNDVVNGLIDEFAAGNRTGWKDYGGYVVNVKDIAHGHSKLTIGDKILQFIGHTPINGGRNIYAKGSVDWRVYFPTKYNHGDLGVFNYGEIEDNHGNGIGRYYIRLRNPADQFTLISLTFYKKSSYKKAKAIIGL